MSLIGYILVGILTAILLLVIGFAFRLRRHSQFFKKHEIPYLGIGLKRLIKFISGSESIVDLEIEFYKLSSKYNNPFVGITDIAGKPNFYITDLDLVKNILVKDFDHFVNRRPVGTQTSNIYLKNMLISMDNEQWKGTRAKLSPSFTTGKIRKMFQIFKNSSERLETYLKKQMETSQNKKSMDIDFLQIFPKYALDVIASCAFGIDSKSFEVSPEQRTVFEQMAQNFGFRFTGKSFFKFVLTVAAPKVADFFGIESMDSEAQTYLSGAIKNVMKKRRETGERHEDFLQLMMDAQKGLLKADEESNQVMNGTGDDVKGSLLTSESQKKISFEDDSVIANGLLFLIAGFDPTQSVLLFTLYALALNPEVQEKLFEEVKTVLNRNGGKLTYEGILEMTYLDMVVNESMRRYSVSTRTERCCTKDYPVPGTSFTIKKGSIIIVPNLGIHSDVKYHENPDKFIPERFTPENKAARHPYSYLPFGHGPRNCIGMRFALVKVKSAIVQLVHTFQFAPCSKTKIPMEFDRNPNVKPNGSMWLNMKIREN